MQMQMAMAQAHSMGPGMLMPGFMGLQTAAAGITPTQMMEFWNQQQGGIGMGAHPMMMGGGLGMGLPAMHSGGAVGAGAASVTVTAPTTSAYPSGAAAMMGGVSATSMAAHPGSHYAAMQGLAQMAAAHRTGPLGQQMQGSPQQTQGLPMDGKLQMSHAAAATATPASAAQAMHGELQGAQGGTQQSMAMAMAAAGSAAGMLGNMYPHVSMGGGMPAMEMQQQQQLQQQQQQWAALRAQYPHAVVQPSYASTLISNAPSMFASEGVSSPSGAVQPSPAFAVRHQQPKLEQGQDQPNQQAQHAPTDAAVSAAANLAPPADNHGYQARSTTLPAATIDAAAALLSAAHAFEQKQQALPLEAVVGDAATAATAATAAAIATAAAAVATTIAASAAAASLGSSPAPQVTVPSSSTATVSSLSSVIAETTAPAPVAMATTAATAAAVVDAVAVAMVKTDGNGNGNSNNNIYANAKGASVAEPHVQSHVGTADPHKVAVIAPV
jgi:hypothetical protein